MHTRVTFRASGCPASFDAASTPIVRKTNRARRGNAFTQPVERSPSTEEGLGPTGRTLAGDGRHAAPPRMQCFIPSHEERHPLACSASPTRKTCVRHLCETRLRREDEARPRVRTRAPSRAPRITHPGDATCSAIDARPPTGRTSSSIRTKVMTRTEESDRSTLC
jgi:hypothetical protein